MTFHSTEGKWTVVGVFAVLLVVALLVMPVGQPALRRNASAPNRSTLWPEAKPSTSSRHVTVWQPVRCSAPTTCAAPARCGLACVWSCRRRLDGPRQGA